jgi:hypothetical protein
MLLDHVAAIEGETVCVDDRMFWAIPADTRYDVYEQPSELTIGQLGESLDSLSSMMRSDEDVVAYGLVWLADILRAVGEQTVR